MSTPYVCPACGTIAAESGTFCVQCGAARADRPASALGAWDVPSKPVNVVIELAVRRFFARYTQFSGRAPANEFWWVSAFFLGIEIVYFVVNALLKTIGLGIIGGLLSFVFLIALLGVLVPSIALAARRMHDTGRSAWWLLIGLIPFIGSIVLLVFYVLPTQPSTNKWGPPDPL